MYFALHGVGPNWLATEGKGWSGNSSLQYPNFARRPMRSPLKMPRNRAGRPHSERWTEAAS